MFSQSATAFHTSASHVYNHFEALGGSLHPGFGQLHAFVFGEHITFAARTVDENSFQSIANQEFGVSGNGSKVHTAIGMERGKRGIDQPDDFLHSMFFICVCV